MDQIDSDLMSEKQIENFHVHPTGIVTFGEKNFHNIPTSITKFYQTHDAKETICIIEDPDGGISIGIARAGKPDLKAGRITSEDGMDIAEGRARKARKLKSALIEKNYLRGLYAMKIEKGCPK